MDEVSERRLVENEVIFRDANKSVQEFIDETRGLKTTQKIAFYCECSNLDCRERIELTTEQYRRAHGNDHQFIVITGHEMPQIEKVVRTEDGYSVVEKFGIPPPPSQVEAALRKINREE